MIYTRYLKVTNENLLTYYRIIITRLKCKYDIKDSYLLVIIFNILVKTD